MHFSTLICEATVRAGARINLNQAHVGAAVSCRPDEHQYFCDSLGASGVLTATPRMGKECWKKEEMNAGGGQNRQASMEALGRVWTMSLISTATDREGGRGISGELYFRPTALPLRTKWVCAVKERAGRRVPSSKIIHRGMVINTKVLAGFQPCPICWYLSPLGAHTVKRTAWPGYCSMLPSSTCILNPRSPEDLSPISSA